jgi:group I intron endonuclease
MYCIYKITNNITGKSYIGYTNNYNKRIANHRRGGKTGVGSCTQLYKSMKKHGSDSFTFNILYDKIESVEEAKILEAETIQKYDTFKTGYNAHPGGTGGDMSSYESFQISMEKMHAKRKPEDYATYGFANKSHKSESKQKQSIARKLHWDNLSDSDKKKLSKKISGSKNGMYGKVPRNAKKVIYNGIEYCSMAEAERQTGLSAYIIKKG